MGATPRARPALGRDPSIRVLTHSPPAPGISGDRIRMYYLIRELKRRGWAVRVWSLVGPAEPEGSVDALRAIADDVVLVPRDLSQARRLRMLAQDTIARRAYYAHWFWRPETASAAQQWLADVDDEPLLVEQLFMYPVVPRGLRRQTLLDTQNDEAARIDAIGRGGGGFGRRLVARLQRDLVARYERDALRSVGCVLAVSDAEAVTFEATASSRVRVVPNGVDVEAITPVSSPPVTRDVLFLGSLGYGPNRDAVRYFTREIAPLLLDSQLRLSVVGSNPGEDVYEAAGRAPVPVTVAGFVHELAPYFTSSRAMIVPLREGAGTRLKILEALAWGLPVVTSSIGGAGLGLIDGTHALIADDPASFAGAVRLLLDDDQLWQRLSRAGRALVESRYAWSRIGDSFDAAAREVIDGPHPAGR
jgi:glycosyltransferase involved in cell wall biosynthesis